jgi:hypothetical protein
MFLELLQQNHCGVGSHMWSFVDTTVMRTETSDVKFFTFIVLSNSVFDKNDAVS